MYLRSIYVPHHRSICARQGVLALGLAVHLTRARREQRQTLRAPKGMARASGGRESVKRGKGKYLAVDAA